MATVPATPPINPACRSTATPPRLVPTVTTGRPGQTRCANRTAASTSKGSRAPRVTRPPERPWPRRSGTTTCTREASSCANACTTGDRDEFRKPCSRTTTIGASAGPSKRAAEIGTPSAARNDTNCERPQRGASGYFRAQSTTIGAKALSATEVARCTVAVPLSTRRTHEEDGDFRGRGAGGAGPHTGGRPVGDGEHVGSLPPDRDGRPAGRTQQRPIGIHDSHLRHLHRELHRADQPDAGWRERGAGRQPHRH